MTDATVGFTNRALLGKPGTMRSMVVAPNNKELTLEVN